MGSGGSEGAGGKNVRVKVQSPVRPDDGSGGQDNTEWVDKFEQYAKMRQMNAREVFRNRQIESDSMYKFSMVFPLTKTVLTTDRLLVGARTFNIRGVDNVNEQNKVLVITTEEGVTD
jgi:SPP1 family predicted phage head-tail adaptor